jgi:hypothetical protein
MRKRFAIPVVLIGAGLLVGWYVFAQDSLLEPLPDFSPGQVLTAAQLNALVARINALTANLDLTPRTIPVDCKAGETVTDALLEARPGDTIRISGTCTEMVTITTDRLTLDGLGSAVLDGGGANYPVIDIVGARSVTIMGLAVQNGFRGILGRGGAAFELNDVTVQNNVDEGIRVDENSTARLTNCAMLNNNGEGILVARNSSTTFLSSIVSNNNGDEGIQLFGTASAVIAAGATVTTNDNGSINGSSGINVNTVSSLLVLGTLSSAGNADNGIGAFGSSRLVVGSGATLTASSNGGAGINIGDASNFNATNARVVTEGNHGHGIVTVNSSSTGFDLNSSVEVRGNATNGFEIVRGSSLSIIRGSTVLSENNHGGLSARESSSVFNGHTLTIRNNAQAGLEVRNNSAADLGGTTTVTGNGAQGVVASDASNIRLAGTTITNNGDDGLQVRANAAVIGTGMSITSNRGNGLDVDDSSANIAGSTITGCGGADVVLTFGARISGNGGNTIGTIACENTALSRGDILCPRS